MLAQGLPWRVGSSRAGLTAPKRRGGISGGVGDGRLGYATSMACNESSIATDESPQSADPAAALLHLNCYQLMMRPLRRKTGLMHVLVTLLVAAWGVPACGGDVGYTFSETGGSGSGGTPPRASGGAATGGNPFIPSTGGQAPGVGGTLPYEEEECPEVLPPPTLHECDPLDAAESCYEFEACLPYIVYPSSEDGCGTPGYGEICVYAGTGQQGDLCSNSGTGCSAGFMCVVGAAGGERCAQICVPGQANSCSNGLICGETDVLGYGVCY